MAVSVRVASSGYLGPVNLGASSISANGSEVSLTRNVVSVIQGTTATTLTLPAPGASDPDWAGSVIILKLLDDVDITISAAVANIDGAADNLELDSEGQTISFYYINETIGWMAGPAKL